MRISKLVLISLILVACPAMIVAQGITGSDHDMLANAPGGWTGTNAVCESCHKPHGAAQAAAGQKLWWADAAAMGGFTGVKGLCYTCHNGTITTVGASTVMSATTTQHLVVGDDCSADNGCHDVHVQNTNGTGKFLVGAAGNTCKDCHDGSAPTSLANASLADNLGDHTSADNHPIEGANGTPATFSCNSADGCHSVHGAASQTGSPSPDPLLMGDNTAGYWGSFCEDCHNGTYNDGAGGPVSEDHSYAYTTLTTGIKHPTTTANVTGGCGACHDPHGSANESILNTDNTNSAYCINCHVSGGFGTAPQVTGNHPNAQAVTTPTMNTGAAFATYPMPWGDEIDDDGDATLDYAGNDPDFILCETCHSTHRLGYDGGAGVGNYFLRQQNSSSNEMCASCHGNN